MRELGIGLVFWPELAAIFEDTDPVDVLEVEPQAYWEKIVTAEGIRYRPNVALLRQIAQFPQTKLLHGVGQPVGGAIDDPVGYIDPLKQAIDLLDPAWVSEHLSFNRTLYNGECRETGFLLPPRQSTAGVKQAVRNIRRYSDALGRPFAFETGVSYLQRRNDELDDGAFFGDISLQADCGILLDVHNLWCNEQNGRQSVPDALAQMPLDRVWELHLAGGMTFEGFRLDAHSDLVPPQVYELAAGIIPRLPNLGAIVFEILPQHLPRVGLKGVRRQLAAMRELWSLRLPRMTVADEDRAVQSVGRFAGEGDADFGEVQAWERSFVAVLRADGVCDPRFSGLGKDPGIRIFRQLINDARRSNLARCFRYSMTRLLLGLGVDETHALLDAYFAAQAPESFAPIEADRFADFLHRQPGILDRVSHLTEILAFEHALVRAAVYQVSTDLVWSVDPAAIFSALDEGHDPPDPPRIQSAMRISLG